MIRANPWLRLLELARVLLRPALDDNFLVGIELNRVAALAVKVPEEVVLPYADFDATLLERGSGTVSGALLRLLFVPFIGAGGIGQALYNAQQLFFYQQMAAYILITAVIVGAVDYASSRFRQDMGLMERYA